MDQISGLNGQEIFVESHLIIWLFNLGPKDDEGNN